MHIFKDSEGRDWALDINFDSRNEVLAKTQGNVDFLDVTCIERLADLATLGSTLYALCEDQIKAKNMAERDFARALKGDAFDRARDALAEELCDFFPRGRRQVLTKTLAKVQKLEQMALDEANRVMDSGTLENSLAAKLKSLSGNSPGSSASTPADSDSAT